MISWRSFTTSKVLPTFVGESGYSATYSASNTRPYPEPDGDDQGGIQVDYSYQGELTLNRTLSSISWTEKRGNSFRASDGRVAVSSGNVGLSALTSVNENTTWIRKNEFFSDGTRERDPTSNSSPLATIRQETTKSESYESGYRTTKTISAYEDDFGNEEPIIGFIWTTTVTGEGTNAKTTVEQISTETTETVEDFKTRPGERTVIATAGEDVEFKTYTATDGDVIVVAHTIYELNSNTFAATANSPLTDIPVTNLSFEGSRFTRSFSDTYAAELTFVIDRTDRTSTTTITTTGKTDVPTTRAKQTQETWKRWQQQYEQKRGCDPERDLFKTTVESYQNIHFGTEIEETITNGTQTTFETFNGASTTTTVTKRFQQTALLVDATSIGATGAFQQRTRTRTKTNTFSVETTTFSVSGNVTKTSTVTVPGFVENEHFPWRSYGDDARRLFSVPNDQTTLHATTTTQAFPETTMNVDSNVSETGILDFFFQGTRGVDGSSTTALTVKEVVTGKFYRKAAGISTSRNNATVVRAAQLNGGIANQNLSFRTQNNHATAGIFLEHNAEHTWNSPSFGLISQGIVGAIPLIPTFSGLMSEGSDGWGLCDSSDYTTVAGSRVGQNFSTTIAWKTIEGTSTKNNTSSGSFTLNSTSSVSFGVSTQFRLLEPWGGFATPNASRTVIVSPGVVLMTTYDAESSGTLSTSYSTGTTETVAPVGPVPVTLSSFLPRVQGAGVYTQRLLDDGMP